MHPIPWTAARDYAEAYGFDQDQTDDLAYFVRKMDSEFLRWYERTHGNKSNRTAIQAKDATKGKVRGLGG